MTKYQIKLRTDNITANTKLTETIYGGWLAQNTGAADVTIYGITIAPGETLSSQSIMNTRPGDLWTEPIDIEIPTNGKLRIIRAICKPL